MDRPYQQIRVEKIGAVFCVKLVPQRLDEMGLADLGNEIARLVDEEGCRKMVLHLGPEDPLCLYSIFLAKLVHLQRRLQGGGGDMVLAHVGPETKKTLENCGLGKLFKFYPDQESAVMGVG